MRSVFNLHLRQAEAALSEGRLEEAADVASRADVRGHHDGQKLISQLLAALVTRGQEHLDSGRTEESERDCRLASGLGGNQTDVARLMASITVTIDNERRRVERNRELLDAAAAEVDLGECSVGGRILERVSSDDSDAERVNDQIAVRREQIEAALQRARQSVESCRKSEAMIAVHELQRLSPQHSELPELIDRITGPAVSEIRQAAIEGRLDRAVRTIESVRPLVEFDPDLSELDHVLDLSRRIAGQIDASRFSEATAELRTLGSLLGEADWVQQLAEQTQQAAGLVDTLRSTPLSLLDGLRQAETSSLPGRAMASGVRKLAGAESRRADAPRSPAPVAGVQGSYVLQLDGVGSALLLSGSRVSIGAVGSRSSRVDLALSGYPQGEASLFERIGSDYRFRAGCAALLNGRPGQEKVLSGNEQIELGRRCRLRFRKPHAASASALLELNGTRLSRADIRTVVLFEDTLIAGPSRSCHLMASSLEQPLVLFRRGGELFVRTGLAGRVQRGAAEAIPVTLGTPIEIGGTRLTVTPAADA